MGLASRNMLFKGEGILRYWDYHYAALFNLYVLISALSVSCRFFGMDDYTLPGLGTVVCPLFSCSLCSIIPDMLVSRANSSLFAVLDAYLCRCEQYALHLEQLQSGLHRVLYFLRSLSVC